MNGFMSQHLKNHNKKTNQSMLLQSQQKRVTQTQLKSKQSKLHQAQWEKYRNILSDDHFLQSPHCKNNMLCIKHTNIGTNNGTSASISTGDNGYHSIDTIGIYLTEYEIKNNNILGTYLGNSEGAKKSLLAVLRHSQRLKLVRCGSESTYILY